MADRFDYSLNYNGFILTILDDVATLTNQGDGVLTVAAGAVTLARLQPGQSLQLTRDQVITGDVLVDTRLPVPERRLMQPRVAHTPGPWKVVGPIGAVFTDGDPYGHGQMHVADVRGWGHLTGRGGGCAMDEDKAIAIQDANARLIAAAPDLYEALKAVTDHLASVLGGPMIAGAGVLFDGGVEGVPTIKAARIAMAKVEGLS